ncbi:MAG: Gfo/Idh/MocA family oxidoreductase [Thermoguttaceae bacterium]|nr:Gfo/Idh/MocA family oxidoreductase [Thermoguttaceae bacterium]
MKRKSRREFLSESFKTGAVLSAATAVQFAGEPRVHASETSTLKIGLVGCGGRGCGAVKDAMTADENVKLVAAADVFPERAKNGIDALRDQFGERISVSDDSMFVGFDAYKEVLKADIDYVILATPQHFRPMTLKAAVEAGKNVFAEKPVAVDGAGIRMVMEAAALAKEKGLNLVSGLVNRYSSVVQDCIKRIHDGAIGDVVTARADRMGGELWKRPRVEGDSEMRYQMRNWVNFNWLASEYINDVTIHQIDVALWAFGDITPVAAYGMGGRLSRRDNPDAGDMYDSMSVVYEFEDGRNMYAFSRQIPGCYSLAEATIHGTKGRAIIGNVGSKGIIWNADGEYRSQAGGLAANPMEHKVLIDAIRSGGAQYVNNGHYMANSTMACILGKTAAFTGKRVTWEEALAMEEPKPETYDFDALPPTLPDEKNRYKIALPCLGWGYLD